jgi:predicted ATP-grasp superfamily ATP-dependent carboligase
LLSKKRGVPKETPPSFSRFLRSFVYTRVPVKSMGVIVTNAKNRIAYNVVCSLGRRGIPVYVGDSVPRAMAFSSRYTSGHFLYPSPYREPERFIDCLITQSQRLRADVLIPVFEETFVAAKYKNSLARHFGLVVPDYSQILLAHNKDRWEHLARKLGLSVPSSYAIEDLRRGISLRELRFPVLIKPKQGGGAWGIREVSTAALLEALLAQPEWAGKPWDRFFVQEKVSGHTHCVAMLFNRGRLRASVAYRQIRDYPTTGGQATMRVSERHEKAEVALQRLLTEMDWHGVCQADFIVEEPGGLPYLIDINPRLWGSLTQAIASGVDFPYLIYRIAREGDVEPISSFKTGVVTRWLGGELAAIPSRLRASDSRIAVLRDFMFPTTPSVLFDDFSFADPLPFAAWSLDALFRALKFRSLEAVSHDSLEGIWK